MTSEHCEVVEDDPDGRLELLGDDLVGRHVEDFDVIKADRNEVDELQGEESLDEFPEVRLEASLLLFAKWEKESDR